MFYKIALSIAVSLLKGLLIDLKKKSENPYYKDGFARLVGLLDYHAANLSAASKKDAIATLEMGFKEQKKAHLQMLNSFIFGIAKADGKKAEEVIYEF